MPLPIRWGTRHEGRWGSRRGARFPKSCCGIGRPDPLLKALEHVADAREAAWGNVNPQILLAVLGDELAEVL